MIKFTTESGSRYKFVDGKLTRLNEKPIYTIDGVEDTTPMVAVQAEVGYPLEIGSCALFITARGPLRTTRLLTLEED